jgi:CDP-paratose 2-epimerase
MDLVLQTEYVDQARRGDHICYISDLSALRRDYPEWELTVPLDEILRQLSGR